MLMDDSLLEYYAACAHTASSDDEGGAGARRGFSGDGTDDSARGQSPWRAASGESPLRGRARLRSPKHRSGRMELKLRSSHGREESEELRLHMSERESRAGPHQSLVTRSEEARRVAERLSHPFRCGPARRSLTWDSLRTTAGEAEPLPWAAYCTDQDAQAQQRHADRAVRDAFVFDALCALRQAATRYFDCATVESVTKEERGPQLPRRQYVLKAEAKASLERRGWTSFLAALQRILAAASQVATLQGYIESFHATIRRIGAHVDISTVTGSAFGGEAAQARSTPATLALGQAAFHCLFRLGVFSRNVMRQFRLWVLEVQELTSSVAGASGVRSPCLHDMPCKAPRTEKCDCLPPTWRLAQESEDVSQDDFSTSPPSLLALLEAVEHNVTPLRRLLHVLEESECFAGLQRWATQHIGPTLPVGGGGRRERAGESLRHDSATATEFDFADQCAEHGAVLLDYLIIRLSALQDTSSMDLYRVYMILLLHCAWPYVLLTTMTICGFVHSLDPHRWRRQLPRLFRSSFAHIRVGDATRRCPTDVLSLMLDCVGYEPDAAAAAAAAGPDKSVSALASSRRFILRCFATFAQKWKQNRKRGSRSPRQAQAQLRETLQHRSADTIASAARESGAQPRPVAPGTDLGSAKNMSVADILRELVNGADEGEEAQPWDSLFTLPHTLKERLEQRGWVKGGPGQDGRQQLAQTASCKDLAARGLPSAQEMSETTALRDAVKLTSVTAVFPPAIPLGFAAADKDVPGQAAYRRAVRHRELVNNHPLCSSHPSLSGDEEDGSDALAAAVDVASDTKRRHAGCDDRPGEGHEPGPLWQLCIIDADGSPDLQLVRGSARGWEGCGEGDHAAGAAERVRSDARTSHKAALWLNTAIPAARWIAAGLLIPIGVVVGRLHERRLERLFRRTRVQRTVPLTPFDLDPNSDAEAVEESFSPPPISGRRGGSGAHPCAAAATRVGAADGRALSRLERRRLLRGERGALGAVLDPARVTPPSFSLFHAVKLLVDVALCRDKPRLVDGFLEKLFCEPHWWQRGPFLGERAAVTARTRRPAAVSTSSRLISSLFADAIRGKRFGDLVSLAVLPKREQGLSRVGEGGDEDMLLTREMLDVFASFQLRFAFPDELALVLLPPELSVAVKHIASSTAWEDQVERTYDTFFWERRRGRYRGSGLPPAADTHPEWNGAPGDTQEGCGIAHSDIWSYVFGYLCSLHFANISLREHRKALHIKDTQDHELLSTLGHERRTTQTAPLPPGRKARNDVRATTSAALSRRAPLTVVSRGLGSAYYSLGFAVYALLSFTLREASAVIYRLERLLSSTEACGTVMQLCQSLDTLLLQLKVICFPFRRPQPRTAPALPPGNSLAHQPASREAGALVEEEVRRAVNAILALSLDPSRMPVKLISTRSRVAVEGLVELMSCLSEASVLRPRLHPLLVILTFNCFYGWEGQANYQFR